ncbi:MAG TPA: glycosyltransferase family 87 protein [Gemmataceae bacterium]|nr:glycosyltransferase family 87 protein [Gemmataceae bacterium]
MCKLTENRRPLLLGLALLLAVAALLVVGGPPSRLLGLPLYDYVSFWAAGRLNLQGQDPYDPALLAALEKQAAPGPGDVLIMWPAPWALTLLMPFSRLDAQLSHLLWLAFQFATLAFAVDWAWRLYGGPREQRWVAWLLALTFLPCYLVLVTGQMGPLLLLGLVGFLHCLKRGRDGWAGAFLVLTAIKPQLTYLFWVALLLWAWEGRRWRLVLGGVLGGLAAMAWPVVANPELPVYYWHSLTQRTQTHSHLSPLLGTALRLAWGGRFGLQFVPMVPGLLWLAWYWRRHRRTWDWGRQLPALLFASFLTTAYGAWPFDLVLLLPALIPVAVLLLDAPRRTVLLAVGCHLMINLLALAQLLADVEYFWFVWLTPALLLACVLVRALARPAPDAPLSAPLAA